MITADTPEQKMKKPKNWQQEAKKRLWASVALAFVAFGTTIGWLNSYPPMAPDIIAIATAVSAIATVGLAIFASLAWKNSEATLANLETQIADQRVANSQAIQTASINNDAAIKAADELATHTRQKEHLARYSTDLLNLVGAAVNGENLSSYTNACTVSWMIWGMELFGSDEEFRELIGKWNTLVAEECRAYRGFQLADTDKNQLKIYEDLLASKVGNIIGNLQTWQVDHSRREEMHEHFRQIHLQGAGQANESLTV